MCVERSAPQLAPKTRNPGNSGLWPRLSRLAPCGNKRPRQTRDITNPKRPGHTGLFLRLFSLSSQGDLGYNSSNTFGE